MSAATRPRKTPRRWSEPEDRILDTEARKQSEADNIDWSLIASKLKRRTNKDCRKRWVNHVCGSLKKGPWDEDEDGRLFEAVQRLGQRWTLVAGEVGQRSPDQCAKRWQYGLDPRLEHKEWTSDEDKLLLQCVEQHGREWKRIQQEFYTGRSRNELKNRYTILTRVRQRPVPDEETNTSSSPGTEAPPTPDSHEACMAGTWEATNAEAAVASTAPPLPTPPYVTSSHADGGADMIEAAGCGDQDDLVMMMLDQYEPYFDLDLGLDAMPPPPPLLSVGEGDGAGDGDLSPMAPPMGGSHQEPPTYCGGGGGGGFGFRPVEDMGPPPSCASPPPPQGGAGITRQYSRVSLEISGCDQGTLDRLLHLLRGASGGVKIEIHG